MVGADPVGFGLVTSLSHPGGNLTGLANFAEVLAAKRSICSANSYRAFRGSALSSIVTNPLTAAVAQNDGCRCRKWDRLDAIGKS